MVKLGDVFPNFTAETTIGQIDFHKWLGDSWALFFSHPADFTPVCTTELGVAAKLAPEFEIRGVKMIALSCDDVASHNKWIQDIKENANCMEDGFPFPIIGDEKREIAVSLDLLDPDLKDAKGLPLTCRAANIIGPDKKLKLSILYPAIIGRNFNEILRVVDALLLTHKNQVATPVNWQPGGECIILPQVPEKDLPKLFPKGYRVTGVPSGMNYMKFTPEP